MTTQTNEISAYVNVQAIKAEYAPFNNLNGFEQGYIDYFTGYYGNLPGVIGMAYDRGQEAAMKVQRASQWLENNVGAN